MKKLAGTLFVFSLLSLCSCGASGGSWQSVSQEEALAFAENNWNREAVLEKYSSVKSTTETKISKKEGFFSNSAESNFTNDSTVQGCFLSMESLRSFTDSCSFYTSGKSMKIVFNMTAESYCRTMFYSTLESDAVISGEGETDTITTNDEGLLVSDVITLDISIGSSSRYSGALKETMTTTFTYTKA